MDTTNLVDAKTEYTKQLQNIITNRIYEGFESIYDDCYESCTDHILLFRNFQKQLEEISKWNHDIIDDETKRIINASECTWIDSLLTAVFVSNTKILTAIKITNDKKNINIKIPKFSHFIHRCYLEAARDFYTNPFLFEKKIPSKLRQSNLRKSLFIIDESILKAIRSLLPIELILKEYLNNVPTITQEKSPTHKSHKKSNQNQNH